MRKLLSAVALLLFVTAIFAAPARRVTKTITVDDRQIEVVLQGDETVHFWQAADGTTFRETADGEFVAFDVEVARTEVMAARSKAATRSSEFGEWPDEPIIGERRGLVILVNTPDVDFTCSDDPNALFSAMMNEPGFSYGTATGSVRDYFLDQSFGLLDYKFDVVGPVMVSHNMAYYGQNNNYGNDLRPAALVYEAVVIVSQMEGINFADYDFDGDGYAEQVYVIYAGDSESSGGGKDTIWPHQWKISYGGYRPVSQNGVRIDKYACSSEMRWAGKNQIDGIGTMCHEFSHCLGLPDLYNVSDPNNYTVGHWSVLSVGCYNNDSDTPASYTAYERWFCGWIEPEELASDTLVTDMPNLDESGKAYIYYNEGNRNEFYILQNIQKKGWNKYAKAHGLEVLHVDYLPSAWRDNNVNGVPSHLRVKLICADGAASLNNEGKDLFPISGKNSLTDTSSPSATVYNTNADGTKLMGKYLTDIRETSGHISFSFSVAESIKAVGLEPLPSATPLSSTFYSLDGLPVSRASSSPKIRRTVFDDGHVEVKKIF